MVQVFIALVSVAFGAVLTAALQYVFWTRQRRQELQSLEEREMRRERRRAVERFREVGVLLIEISRSGIVSGPNVNQTELTTTTLIENYRLRRELLNAAAAVRDAFPNQDNRLAIFQKMTERVPLDPKSADTLRAELDALLAALRADVSISDK